MFESKRVGSHEWKLHMLTAHRKLRYSNSDVL